MSMTFYPLLFEPVYKDYIWGGQRISSLYQRRNTPSCCAESWEISAHPDGMSCVTNGAFAGTTLADLTTRLGVSLTGTEALRPDHFPLLLKLIDARESLSVQVHPSDSTASLTGGEPKTEMWYVLDKTQEACLYAGLRPGTTFELFKAGVANGTAQDRLFRLPVESGEALFIPGGLVHAISAGCLIYEVQQSSNTTYRIYDWGRVDTSGRSRPLHLEQAFKVIDTRLSEPKMIRVPRAGSHPDDPWREVLSCPYFRLRTLQLTQPTTLPLNGTTFYALFTASGSATVTVGTTTVPLTTGSSCLIPAGAGAFTLCPLNESASILVTTLT